MARSERSASTWAGAIRTGSSSSQRSQWRSSRVPVASTGRPMPSGASGSGEYAAAVAGRAVDEGVDARRRRRLRGVEVLEALEDRRLEEVAVAPLLDARAVSGEHIDHRKPPLGVVVVARRKPHQQPPARGVAEGVAGEGGAVDRVVDEPAPARRGTERLGGKRPR